MCGIVGGFSLSEKELPRLLDRLQHRGPDSRGHFAHGNFRAGMTRLAILDLRDGTQPFHSADGRLSAICNGEIYNWRTLRHTLEQKGHRFTTRCDCEILPAAFLEWGPSMLTRLEGMFALAIYDRSDRSLLLARDRCGEKPLYLTTSGPLRFASEIKALGLHLEPDPRHLSTWLALRYLPEPQTLFRGIETLPAAHYLTLKAHQSPTLTRYWSPPHTQTPLPREAALDQLDKLARRSVAKALQADVPIAAYLSAGVDSSLLTHYLKDLGADVQTVSLGFGAGSDETPAAHSFATSLGLPHHPTQLTPASLAHLPRVIAQMDRPIGDPLILAFDHLASHTRSLGCKVALGGEGPDEHFAGYSFQKAYARAAKAGPLGRAALTFAINTLPTAILDRLANFPASLGRSGRAKITNYLRSFSTRTPFQQITGLHTLFEPSEISPLIHPDHRPHQLHLEPTLPTGHSPLDTALRSQYLSWLQDWSLIRQDKNTMAHSLEYRAPFLNHHLIDFAFTQPDHHKISPTQDKALWRQLAARHLHPSVCHRPKQPFYLPLEHPSWRTPLLALAQDTLSPANLERFGWIHPHILSTFRSPTDFLPLKQLASLIILHLWLDQFTTSP